MPMLSSEVQWRPALFISSIHIRPCFQHVPDGSQMAPGGRLMERCGHTYLRFVVQTLARAHQSRGQRQRHNSGKDDYACEQPS